MYHRVAQGELDPWRLCVSPARFEEQLEWLEANYEIASLRDVVGARAADGGCRVAITFDDGYVDNLIAAVPVLRRHDVPATFFLTSGALGSDGFWWDKLEKLLLHSRPLPSAVEIPNATGSQTFDLGPAAAAPTNLADEGRRVVPWNAPPTTRLGIFYAIWKVIACMNEPSRHGAIEALAAQVTTPEMPKGRPLTTGEARALANTARMDIGAHGVTHSFLSTQPATEQHAQLIESKQALERLIRRPVTAFAYPHGDYSDATVGIARSVGYEVACTVVPGTVDRSTDPLQVPRIGVEDYGAHELKQCIERFLH